MEEIVSAQLLNKITLHSYITEILQLSAKVVFRVPHFPTRPSYINRTQKSQIFPKKQIILGVHALQVSLSKLLTCS